jgi:phenylpropionate dioxygenase-like ring-hydroxylating dioxygenase large terminal subunit
MSKKNHNKVQQLVAAHQTGYALDRAFYFDQQVYQTELKQLFFKHWLYAGHSVQLAKPGDYFTFEIERESIIICRTKRGEIKAFMNVCRHRGSRICLSRQGSESSFVCPYHAWHYNLDGELIAARNMSEDFVVQDYNLRQVKLAVLGGLIFVSLADSPLGLESINNNLSAVFALYGFEQMKLAYKQRYVIPANWKLAVENYQECYHCGPAHPEFAKLHAMAKSPQQFLAKKQAYWQAHCTQPKFQSFDYYFNLAEAGQEGFQYDHNPLNKGVLTGSQDGQAVAPLLGELTDYSGGASELMIGPLSYFLIYDDHLVAYQFLPSAVDECVCEVSWLVNGNAVEGQDYQQTSLTWLWHTTTEADKRIITHNQQGVASQFYQPGPLSPMEGFQQQFLAWYLAALN